MVSAGNVTASSSAPSVTVSPMSVMSVEHPCIVKSLEKAVDMIGGSQAISQALVQGTERALALSFSPKEPSNRAILSHHLAASNLLLRVTVPRRTGRKRKRGTSEPFLDEAKGSPAKRDATYLLNSIVDNKEDYAVEALAKVDSMHIWRNMPDLVYSTQDSAFLQDLKTKVLPQQLSLLKEWSLPQTYGLQDTETFPPPVWSTTTIPQYYTYRQNPAVKTNIDPSTGKQVLYNQQAAPKIYTQQLQWDISEVPQEPTPDTPPLSGESNVFRKLVSQLQNLFDQRPIWTRRALVNMLPEDAPFFLVRYAVAYVAYAMRSGPWRDAYIKFGVDPRSDPQYRKYQTLLFQLVPKDSRQDDARGIYQRSWTRSRDTESHIFTGTKLVPHDGKVWQVCDLEDAQLKALANTPTLNIRAVCEPRYFGWYANGTTAKMRVALKAKIDALAAGDPLPDTALERFLSLPDSVDYASRSSVKSFKQDPTAPYLAQNASRQETEWAAVYRNLARTESGTLPTYGSMGKGRISKPKPTYRPSYISNDLRKGLDRNIGSPIGEQAMSVNGSATSQLDANFDEEVSGQYADPAIDAEHEEDSDGVSQDVIDILRRA